MTHPQTWYIAGQSEGGRYITVKAKDAKTVCRVPFSNPDDPFPDDHDRALLIAAAPDMLAALETIYKAAQFGRPYTEIGELARQAIAKATNAA